MAKTATAKTTARRQPREIVLTASSQNSVNEIVDTLWAQLYQPIEGDAEASLKRHNLAADKMQKIFEGLREKRDNDKPVIRQRAKPEEVLAESIGKPLTDLQNATVTLDLGAGLTERVTLPKLRQFSDATAHPFHKAAVAFMEANEIRFVERDGKTQGRKVTYLEAAE